MNPDKNPTDVDRARMALSKLRDGDNQKRRQAVGALRAVLNLLDGEALGRLADELGVLLEKHLPGQSPAGASS